MELGPSEEAPRASPASLVIPNVTKSVAFTSASSLQRDKKYLCSRPSREVPSHLCSMSKSHFGDISGAFFSIFFQRAKSTA